MLGGLGQTRPINPLITELMTAIEQHDEDIAIPRLFKRVPTAGRTGTFYKDDAQNSLGSDEDPEWGNNVPAKDVDIRLGSASFTVYRRAFRTSVTAMDKKDFIGPMALENFVAKKLMDRMNTIREIKGEAVLRGSSAIQSQAAGTNWGSSGLDPIKNVNDLAVKIAKSVGTKPGDAFIPKGVWDSRFMTIAANTAGLQMRTTLGNVIAMTTDAVDAQMAARWLGIKRVTICGAVKAGKRTSTPETGGTTGGGYIWTDTTQLYLAVVEDNPSIGSTGYGATFGYQDIAAEGPYYDWQIDGDWYRVSSVLGEVECLPNAAGKITGV